MIERADINQYNPALDSQRFTALMAQRETAGFETALTTERAYIGQQLQTDLGERLDVAKSTFVYEIRDGKLYEPGRPEPFEETIKRGNGRNPIDAQRDKAELGSFTGVIQDFLAEDDTPDGTTILSVSPRGQVGSFEEKNFFQVYIREGKQVKGARYYSDLTNAEYRRKIISINPIYETLLSEKPTDVDLKSSPVVVPSYLDYSDPDKLARFLLGREVGMPEEQLDEVVEAVTPLVTSYINTLIDNPEDLYWLEKNYRALLNGAHEASEQVLARELARNKEVMISNVSNLRAVNVADRVDRPLNFMWSDTRIEIEMLSDKEIKIGGGACGSGSCSTADGSSSIPTSELDNIDGRGPINFPCPDCGKINTRPLFQYVRNCQKCGSDEVLPPSLRKAAA